MLIETHVHIPLTKTDTGTMTKLANLIAH